MRTKEYTVKVITYPSQLEGYEVGVIEVMRDSDGVDQSLRFLSPSENKSKIYIPLGTYNNEPGTGERKLIWVEKDKVLSITPSIQVLGGGREHFHIVNNKVVY